MEQSDTVQFKQQAQPVVNYSVGKVIILNHWSKWKSSKQQFCKPHSTVVAEMWEKDIIITTLTARLGGWTSVSEGFEHPLSSGKTIYIPHTKPKVFLLIQQTYQLSLQLQPQKAAHDRCLWKKLFNFSGWSGNQYSNTTTVQLLVQAAAFWQKLWLSGWKLPLKMATKDPSAWQVLYRIVPNSK